MVQRLRQEDHCSPIKKLVIKQTFMPLSKVSIPVVVCFVSAGHFINPALKWD
jgi:hypothetical protein